MAKSRKTARKPRKPTVPHWDMGADGPANRNRLVKEQRGTFDYETGKTVNPNGVVGMRVVDMMKTYHDRGWISKRGYSAGEKLRDAWENTQRGPAGIVKERVDRTQKADAAIDIQIDRMSVLTMYSCEVPPEHREIIDTVARQGIALGQIKRYRGSQHEKGKVALREAFEALADNFERLR